MEETVPTITKTTCPYCGVGCGILATVGADGTLAVRGDPDHPANFGRLCSKGSALAETVDLEGRLLFPEIDGRRAGWDEALDRVAETFSRTIAEHGPDSVAFYVSGQLLNEDYYVVNKLMKGFIGTANIDTNSRLCMASSVAGHRRAFGADTVPGSYRDLELADLVVLVGSNLAWCHPVLYQRLAAAKAERPEMKVIVVDPRRTMTADIADQHLAIAPDGDVALFNGLLAHLAEAGALDENYIAEHTTGFAEALAAAWRLDMDGIAAETGLDRASIAEFYRLFAATEKVVTVYSQGVNQSSVGTDKVSAIINCHLATGRIGRPGMGPFSVTGQPNAMGGREVGGLANMLAAHMDIDNAADRERVQRFWRAPVITSAPGLKAVDMFRAVADGRIKALWIMATNPVDSMPDGDMVETAIRACPFVVVSDVVGETDTLRHAHVKLPAAAWGEKDGTVTNSERRMSRQRPFLPLPGEAKPDWWIVTEVARRMGFAEAFPYASPAEIFAEHAALSAFENHGARDFDIGAHAGIDAAGFDALAPFQWPARAGETPADDIRFFAEGGFFTPDRKARLVPVTTMAPARTSEGFPLVLNTGRVRDQWHTMTRTGKSQRLSQHLAEPFVEIHPTDAATYGIADADLVRVTSARGAIVVRALLTSRQREGSIFVPMHWTDQFAADGRVDRLVPPIIDSTSGQPALKHVAVRIARFTAAAYGFAVLTGKPKRIAADYWAIARCEGGWRVELAFANAVADWPAVADAILPGVPDADTLSFQDAVAARRRFARFVGERLIGALYLAAEPVAVPRDWVVEQLSQAHADQRARLAVLAGRPGKGGEDKGAIVCSCFGVGVRQIAGAVVAGCHTVEAVGDALLAGTNCGSCRAEIRSIIHAHRLQAAE
ncbi:Molybdopterin oxidoreductase Fe4S4 domain/Molybdopterin oxidoreductase/BFD-like [2Fe-2S] binding domain/Molydopterin dinucleotide binding domain [Chelatococcus sambhunathii]|uniref:Molybdopterin oxidoreductase Fe4S4 domain/Molybdopterin oxidoreductase/BFD-like [2Fe-2S] binding domain/Molydopterin dinucleotide binding domain n=1 Tax=Chelatococcus sambhunathii TaxID=363953 RepID=A0ABP2A8W2_9HYPH|nr:nitrate reductase [Chelatococcus sambhunathii]CUA89365.1 Molybdopterin oxidoreductase Fe4S4 domain/Molybdopterin oxidoreductase/BFD-like [2Fe-2S] binding domain/Molydopterin dinucleotide binding domain [Chelatococcus sambhunathii]